MNYNLFDSIAHEKTWTEKICKDAVVLRHFASPNAQALFSAIQNVTQKSPFRHMQTRGGYTMSVALSSCGKLGWVSDHAGYRYSQINPETGNNWPAMPTELFDLAQSAAAAAGYDNYQPDSCLINRYVVGARMSLHQDRNERDFNAPIVSLSLGLPSTFLFGGLQREDKIIKVPLAHGDVAVWGGESRLNFHGISPIKAGYHPLVGEQRINVTFRMAG